MFRLETHQNPYLPAGATRVEAVLSVTATAGGAAVSTGEGVFGLVLDTSGSMAGRSIAELKQAAKRSIALVGEHVSLFVVSFADRARVLLPLAEATAKNKKYAQNLVDELDANGGTRFAAGLAAARAEVGKRPGARAHVLFLTDGKDDKADHDPLVHELVRCDGHFQADCRGLGTDWEPAQLRQIADRLLGTAAIVPAPEALEEDFRQTTERALGRSLPNVRLRIATPRSSQARLALVQQTSPQLLDLTARGHEVEQRGLHAFDFQTGAWAEGETRDFLIALEVPSKAPGEEMLLARPSLVAGRPEVETRGAPIVAAWTTAGDERSALLNSHVAHYTGQVKIAEEIRTGLAARQAGAIDRATELLGSALAAAEASGNAEVTVRIKELVERDATGTVRLKEKVQKAHVMDLELSSIVTARPRKSR